MAEFPSGVYSPRTIENRPGIVYDPDDTKTFYKEDFDGATAEIVAIETELGANPKGSHDSVADRFGDLEALPCMNLGSVAEIALSGATAIANAGFNLIPLNSQVYNYGSDLQVDTTNRRIKALTAGVYLCQFFLCFADNVNGDARGAFLYKNGGQIGGGFISKDVVGRYYMSYTRTLVLAVNDYVDLRGYQNSGGNLNANSAWLNVMRIR